MIRRYFTLEDLVLMDTGTTDETYKGPNFIQEKGIGGLYTLLEAAMALCGWTEFSDIDDEKTQEVTYLHIYPRFHRSDIFYMDFEENDERIDYTMVQLLQVDEFKEALGKWIGKVYTWFKDSQDRYNKVLTAYNTLVLNIAKGLSSESKSRANTVPQGTTSDPYDLGYTNTASTTETTAEDMNALDKMNEIRNKIYSVYSSWAEEFKAFIVRYH